MSTLDLSVVICTRNRVASLARSLAAVAELQASFAIEVLVIDNGSDDETMQMCSRFGSRLGRLRAVREPEIGLSRARNRGVAEACSPLVAYLDDDAAPERGWAAALRACFAQTGATVVGGPILPRFETAPPPFVSARHLGAWSCQDLGSERRQVTEVPYLFGANFAVRRDRLIELGGFDERLGRKAASLLSGEDTELCERVIGGGGRIFYEPRAVVHHWISAERLSGAFFRRRALATGQTRALRLGRAPAAAVALALAIKAAKLPAHGLLWALAAMLGRQEAAAEREWSLFATLGTLGYFALPRGGTASAGRR